MANKIDLSGDGGVLKEITHEGIGDETPLNGCTVSLHYTGKLTDGKVFDSSLDRNEPFEFALGRGNVIKAFEIGILTMKKGEKCSLTCRSDYAYGKNGSPPSIPPDATLIFELEMLDWKGEDLSPETDNSIERFIITKSDKKKSPNEYALVKIHMIGKYEGNVFENREVEFNIGEGCEHGIIEGIEIALLKVMVGETCRLKIKQKYAFGAEGNKAFNIPANATVEYTVSLLECERAEEEWKLDNDESLNQAKVFKEKGSKYVKEEKFKLAIKMYQRSNNFLSNCDSQESKNVKVAVFSNIALCQLKLKDYFETKTACNVALEIDPKNIKGLYRRGQANMYCNDYENAIKDFEQIIEIEPKNNAAIKLIQECKSKIKEYYQKEKKIYANMFSKFAANDKEKENADNINGQDVLNECGEWTDEDALKEADKAFERMKAENGVKYF